MIDVHPYRNSPIRFDGGGELAAPFDAASSLRETRVFSAGFSEKELQGQLDDPRVGRSVNTSEVSVVPGYVGIVELRVVEDVEEFSAKLEAYVFTRPEWVEVLDKPRIHVELAGPAESALADVPEAPGRRQGN